MRYALKETCVEAVLVRRQSGITIYDCGETYLLPFLAPFKERFSWERKGDDYIYFLDGRPLPYQVYLVVIKGELTIMSKKQFRKLFERMGSR